MRSSAVADPRCKVTPTPRASVYVPNSSRPLNMGLFTRKTCKHPTDDEEIHKSQIPRPYLVASVLPTSIYHKQTSSVLSETPSTMPVPDVPISKSPEPSLNPAAYLRSIHAVRERSQLVMLKAKSNQLSHFDVNMDMFQNTANYMISIIKVCTISYSAVINVPSAEERVARLRR